jgi:hypothetical protein
LSKWKDMGNVMFQGEVDLQGKWDGKAICITKNSNVEISYYRKGLQHGQSLVIHKDGSKESGTCIKGVREGKFVQTLASGK